MDSGRWIDLDGVANMRDLGGLPTIDGGWTAPRRLIRSDNLQELSDADVERLVTELGVTDVLDLRTPREIEQAGPGPLRAVTQVRHHEHSILRLRSADGDDEQPASGSSLARSDHAFWGAEYVGYLRQRPAQVSAALRVIAEAGGAVIVHCAAGKHRTGTIVAIALQVAGVEPEAIVADYLATTDRMDAIFDRLRRLPGYAEHLATQTAGDQLPVPQAIEALLSELGTRGGGAGWLTAQGWTEQDLASLRTHLRD